MYLFFIIAFAIGFYVSLNTSVIPPPITTEKSFQEVETSDDTSLKLDNGCQNATIELILKKIEGLKDENFNFFKDGWRAMVKTSTMFSGELVS